MIVKTLNWTALARDVFRQWQSHAPLSMQLNSISIMLSVVAAGAFGQVTWVLAARLSAPREVGIASAYMSGALLCAQLSLMGLGSAVIALLPRHRNQSAILLRTLLTTVAGAGLLAGVVYLAIGLATLHELGSFFADRRAMLMVVAQAGALPTAMMFDQSAVAIRRADGVLERSIVGGFVRIGLLVCLWLITAGTLLPALSITLAWFGSTLLACAMGHGQIGRIVRGFAFRPAVHREFVRQGLLIGFPNHFVSLAIVGPGLVLSILVAELLSPSINAYWYIAWMLAGIVFVVPSSNGLALFAELTNYPERMPQANMQSIRSSLFFGVPLAAGLGLVGGWALPLLGQGYITGVTPVRLMVLGVVPMTFVETYVANCRALHNLREPAITLAIGGIATIVAAALGGLALGLNGVALAWLAVECAMGVWAGWRLRAVFIGAPRLSASLRYEAQVGVFQASQYGTED